MIYKGHILRITIRLVFIFLAMLLLAILIGKEARLFSVIAVLIITVALMAELFHKLSRTNRIIESLLDSIRSEDYNRKIHEQVSGLGFENLADSAQSIIKAISSARIEKEKQFQYLQNILKHIHTAVLTLGEDGEPELINPLALNILGIYQTRKPSWNEIEKASPVFAGTVKTMGDRGREMIRLNNTPAGKQLLVLLHTVRVGENKVKIITFQDIEPEIEQKELESWQTISRIMAHEIMNSLTPLSSLTETGIMMLEEKGQIRKREEITQQTIENLHTALRTISDRNKALTTFIGNYRQLSRLPEPDKVKIRVSELLDEVTGLHRARCAEKGITCSAHTGPDNLVIMADDAQLKQVLINLIKNAMEATDHIKDPRIEITVKRVLDDVAVEVHDNGTGIPPDILEKIFVPFYSTKAGGSGIGLSLSRQIIRNHGGQISVQSGAGKGTTFRISLPLE